MLDLLSGFVTELRRSGLPVSLTEHLDAAEAVKHIPLEDREGLKYALAATLVKSSSHWRAFETAFEVFFAVRPAGSGDEDEEEGEGEGTETEGARGDQGRMPGQGRSWKGGGGGEGMTPEELADQVARIVRSLRTLELRKAPSVSETLDWARTLVLLGVETIDATEAKDTLHILLKYQADIERATKELLSASPSSG